jgi:proteic killer suppression protein
VNLAFRTLKLREVCLSQTKAEAKYGYKVAKLLRERLADLRAAETVLELVAGRPREIPSKPHNKYAISLTDGYRLVLRVNHAEVPLQKSGQVDWALVTRVMILGIEVSDD